MGLKATLRKLNAPIVWGNLLGMAVLLVAILVAVIYWLDAYTLHGQVVRVPDVKQKKELAALEALEAVGLQGEVRDTGYVATLPAGIIIDQSETAGKEVKPGRIIYLTVNSGHARLVAFPDIADNSSLREAQTRLQAMGFRLAPVRYTHGEREWVYEVRVNGRSVRVGEQVPCDAEVTLFVGNGYDTLSDSLLDGYTETDETLVSEPATLSTSPQQPSKRSGDTPAGYDF